MCFCICNTKQDYFRTCCHILIIKIWYFTLSEMGFHWMKGFRKRTHLPHICSLSIPNLPPCSVTAIGERPIRSLAAVEIWEVIVRFWIYFESGLKVGNEKKGSRFWFPRFPHQLIWENGEWIWSVSKCQKVHLRILVQFEHDSFRPSGNIKKTDM